MLIRLGCEVTAGPLATDGWAMAGLVRWNSLRVVRLAVRSVGRTEGRAGTARTGSFTVSSTTRAGGCGTGTTTAGSLTATEGAAACVAPWPGDGCTGAGKISNGSGTTTCSRPARIMSSKANPKTHPWSSIENTSGREAAAVMV